MSVKEMDLTPLVDVAAKSATSIAEYSIVGAFAIVFLVIAAVLMWVVLKQAKECHESTKTVVANNTSAVTDLKESNSAALHGVQMALVKIETMLSGR